jgi:hypothetical protein
MDLSVIHSFVAFLVYAKVLLLVYFGIKFLLSKQETIDGTHLTQRGNKGSKKKAN